MHFLSLILFILVVALQAADGYLTWRILRAGRELNPLMKFLMDRLGTVPGLVLAKLVLVVLVGLYLRDQVPIMLAIVALYAWVVRHNWRQLFKGSAA